VQRPPSEENWRVFVAEIASRHIFTFTICLLVDLHPESGVILLYHRVVIVAQSYISILFDLYRPYKLRAAIWSSSSMEEDFQTFEILNSAVSKKIPLHR
jgi:hypothetical protein